ncbi:MAG: InlB B-repeat-containing protein [Candidatus Methanomethylophilus sp.]|nr:InlB B-repeat-containing protein [Methanomethylophilus sp.]MCI2074786.1 InlB B-repeat-containing protein [Methanomethylophilus sp.]
MQVTYGADPVVLTPNGFSRTGYTFASWNTQADGGGAVFADEVLVSDLTESIILYAQWTADTYTVTFDGNGSTSGSTASVSVTYDAGPVALTTNGFTRTGYTFTGWNTETDGNGTSYSDGASVSNLTSSFTLYAQWTANTYEVTFDGNGSTSGTTDPISVTYGAEAVTLTLNGFSRTGYTFTGWNDQADGEGTAYSDGASISNITSALTLYAQWSADTYDVTFDGNGADGGSTLSVSVTYGAGDVTLTSNGFTKTGYSFTGWNTQADGEGTAYSDGATVSNLLSALILYAQWTANTYTVSFDGNGSTSGATASVNVTYDAGPVALTLNDFVRTGYSFAGWNTQADGEGTAYSDGQAVSNLTSALTLYAQWTANTYTVTFVGNGSTSGTTDPMEVTYGEAAKALTLNSFSKTGYTFASWNTQADGEGAVFVDGALVSDLTDSIILYAQWSANTYIIFFDGNGSTSGTTDSVPVTYDAGDVALTSNGFTRTGYTFSGWNTQADGEGTAYSDGESVSDITSSFTLYAQWTIITFTISYDGNGSDRSSTASQTVDYGGSLTVSSNGFTKTGYSFAGWNTQADGEGTAYAAGTEISDITSSFTLYAQWTANTYVVTFDGNGNTSGTTDPVSVTYDAGDVILTANGFTRTGYTFSGWNTQADGEGDSYADGATVSNLLSALTLYAQWSANTYTISFDGNGSTSGTTASVSVTYDADPVALTANGFTRTGYTFAGWEDSDGNSYTDGQYVSGLLSDITLYAQWTINTYMLSYEGNGSDGGSTATQTVTYGGSLTVSSNGFAKTGYSFAGWNTQTDGEGTSYAAGSEISGITSDITLYAKWTARTHTVTFDGNGSTSGTTASMQVTYGEAAKSLTLSGFSRTGYTFAGWNTAADGSGASYADGAEISDLITDLILYAQWEEDSGTNIGITLLALATAILIVLAVAGAVAAVRYNMNMR